MEQQPNLKDSLEGVSALSSQCCIYRVPKRLRDLNEKAYTPQVVSIGPLHHGREGLEGMEDHKIRYLKDFLERTKVSMESCYNTLKGWESSIRDCYAVKLEFNEHELVEIVLVDSIFTFELLLRAHYPTLREEKIDRIFGKPWMLRDITYDMLLLENQVPFFILDYLYSLAVANKTIPMQDNLVPSIAELTYEFFRNRVYLRPLKETMEKMRPEGPKPHHFVDFLLICHRPAKLPDKKRLATLSIPSATELQQAGVMFMNVEEKNSQNLFDIKFENGVLKIPHLRIRGSTELFFRNLIAYEQCEFRDHYLNDYVFIIDRLVDSSEDVDILVKSGILESKLPDSEAVASYISSLDSGPILFSRNFYFTDLCDDLNAYYRVPWHKWKASLKQDYFSTPWAGLSIFVAAILVILTFIQTVCSVMAV